jgi:hypothetical protein
MMNIDHVNDPVAVLSSMNDKNLLTIWSAPAPEVRASKALSAANAPVRSAAALSAAASQVHKVAGRIMKLKEKVKKMKKMMKAARTQTSTKSTARIALSAAHSALGAAHIALGAARGTQSAARSAQHIALGAARSTRASATQHQSHLARVIAGRQSIAALRVQVHEFKQVAAAGARGHRQKIAPLEYSFFELTRVLGDSQHHTLTIDDIDGLGIVSFASITPELDKAKLDALHATELGLEDSTYVSALFVSDKNDIIFLCDSLKLPGALDLWQISPADVETVGSYVLGFALYDSQWATQKLVLDGVPILLLSQSEVGNKLALAYTGIGDKLAFE